MRISQLAERSGVPATTLRFYEGAGLLPAERTAAGYRVYGESAVERLAFIGAAKHLGLPLEEIGALLSVWESGACREVKADLRPRIAARWDEAQQRVTELTAFMASLHSALDHLDALPDRDEPCDPHCGFLTGPRPTEPTDEAITVHRHTSELDSGRWRTAPVACSLSGTDRNARTAHWRAVLDGTTRVPISGGLRVTLPAERMSQVTALAVAEQQCCPFFDFRFHLDGPDLHLEVRAPAEGAPLLGELFGPAT